MEHLREWKHNLKEFAQPHRWQGVSGCSSNELCDFCTTLLKELASSSAILHSYPRAKLIGLEHAQCGLCRLVFKAAEAIADHTGEESIQVYVDRGQLGSGGKCTLAVGPQGSGSPRHVPPFYNIYRRTSHDNPSQLLNLIHYLPDYPADTGSDLTVDWIRQRLQTCCTKHSSCPGLENKPLPTRVLDLGLLEDPGIPSVDISLYETKGESSHYIALSHCWGGKQPIRTTRKTIESHQRGIPVSALPRTFRDAVSISRRLGFRYLWIDSLCVIQDDDNDWAQEAARMCDGYEGASLVIAATEAGNPDVGLFRSDPRFQWRHEIYVGHKNESIPICIRRRLHHEAYTKSAVRHTSYSEFLWPPPPLSVRAWAFQERMLARRMIHFLNQEIVWECQDEACCQCGQLDNLEQRDRFFCSPTATSWSDWVEYYSALSLTYPSDKLPAISGLARYLHRLYANKLGGYLAGIWEATIPHSLLWRSLSDDLVRPRQVSYRAPSWSWASTDSVVHLPRVNKPDRLFTTVLDIRCTPKGPDLFGETSSGHLLLSGPLTEAMLGIFAHDRHTKALSIPIPVRDYLSGVPASKSTHLVKGDHYIWVIKDYLWEVTPPSLDIGLDPRTADNQLLSRTVKFDRMRQQGMLYFMKFQVCRGGARGMFVKGTRTWTYLILNRLGTSGNEYERIGIAISDVDFGGNYRDAIVKII